MDSLPLHLWYDIGKHLSVKDKTSLARVNVEWYQRALQLYWVPYTQLDAWNLTTGERLANPHPLHFILFKPSSIYSDALLKDNTGLLARFIDEVTKEYSKKQVSLTL
jgi:hypothetical protein